MITSTLDQRNAIAEALGINPDEIKATNPHWADLLKEGVIVELHLRRWRGQATLNLDDIGVPINGEEQLYSRLLSLGSKRLLPKALSDEMDAIDSAARKCLLRYGLKTYWGQFVPVTAFEDWQEENCRYEQRYQAVRQQIRDEYEQIVALVMDDYAEAARAAFRRRHMLQAGHDDDLRFLPEDGFVDAFCRHIRGMIPTAEQIYDSFAYETELSYVPLAHLLEEDLRQMEETRLQRMQLQHEMEIEEERIRIATRAERDQARHAEMQRLAQRQHEAELRMIDKAAAQQRAAATTAMHQQVMARAAQHKEGLIAGFLRDIAAQLRSLIYDAATSILESIDRNEYLHPRSLVQIENLAGRVERLNFFGDADADAMIAELKRITVDRPSTERSTAEIQSTLRDIAVVTRASIIQLGDTPKSGRQVGIPDAPKADIVRQARARLGVNLDLSPALAPAQQRIQRTL